MLRKFLCAAMLVFSIAACASSIDTVAFCGAQSGLRQRMCVYLPSDYDTTRTYPVLYLMHGIHGNQFSWLAKGRLQPIMDSLIAAGEVAPMVVVMPFCQIGDTCDRLNPGSLLRCCLKYPLIKHGKFERYFFEIVNYVDEHYAVRSDRSGRAIAGLSCGARQAAIIARDSSYCACGLFCPIIYARQLPPASMHGTEFWVAGGKKDFFLGHAKRFYRHLQQQGTESLFYTDPNGHSWLAWQNCIRIFTERYFPGGESHSDTD